MQMFLKKILEFICEFKKTILILTIQLNPIVKSYS